MKIDTNGLNKLRDAIDDVLGYLSDNSCCDTDCCGGSFYDLSQFEDGRAVLVKYGLDYCDTCPTER